jgi:hypothetical protein
MYPFPDDGGQSKVFSNRHLPLILWF